MLGSIIFGCPPRLSETLQVLLKNLQDSEGITYVSETNLVDTTIRFTTTGKQWGKQSFWEEMGRRGARGGFADGAAPC